MDTSHPTIVPLSTVEAWNFRAIQHLQIQLHKRLNVLIGENASGKTSLIEAIAVGLGAIASRIPGGHNLSIQPLQIHRRWDRPAAFAGVKLTSGTLSWSRVLYRDKTRNARAEARASMGRINLSELYKVIDPPIFNAGENAGEATLPLVAFYGTERAVADVPMRERGFNTDESRFDAFAHCLGATTNFKRMFEWFLGRNLWEAHEKQERGDWSDPAIEAVRGAVVRAVPQASNLRVAQRPIRMLVDVEARDGTTNPTVVQNLSGGQRTMLAMVADLARRMVQANPHLGLASPAIVLIDEVDLHLHPRWQETVLDNLLEIFPSAQFIVTTHSEQIISSVPSECIHRLVDSAGGVCASGLGAVRGATWDETLQDAMGLEADRPAEPARLLNELWDLVRVGEGESEAARELEVTIRTEFPGAASELDRVRFEVRRRAGLAKLQRGNS